MWFWFDKFFARYEFWLRWEGCWLIVQVHRIALATRVVFTINNQEVSMTDLHEGNTILLTAKGKRGTADKPLDPTFESVWTASAEGIVAISPVTGTKTASLSFVGPGTVTITEHDDADPGAAVVDVSGTIDINCIAALATSVEITAGPEVPIP